MTPEKIQAETAETNDSLWKLRMIAAGLWTGLVFVFTTLFLAVLLTTEPSDTTLSQEDADNATALATVIVSGCAGGGWLCGLVVILIVSAVLRR